LFSEIEREKIGLPTQIFRTVFKTAFYVAGAFSSGTFFSPKLFVIETFLENEQKRSEISKKISAGTWKLNFTSPGKNFSGKIVFSIVFIFVVYFGT